MREVDRDVRDCPFCVRECWFVISWQFVEMVSLDDDDAAVVVAVFVECYWMVNLGNRCREMNRI